MSAGNFLRDRGSESCTRLCALLCCATGCTCWIATEAFAFFNPGHAATVDSLSKGPMTLIAFGCVALLSRKRKDASSLTAGGAE